MKAIDIWNQGINVLPEELANSFGKLFIKSTEDNERGIIRLKFRNRNLEYKLFGFSPLGHGLLAFIKQVVRYKNSGLVNQRFL